MKKNEYDTPEHKSKLVVDNHSHYTSTLNDFTQQVKSMDAKTLQKKIEELQSQSEFVSNSKEAQKYAHAGEYHKSMDDTLYSEKLIEDMIEVATKQLNKIQNG